MIYKDWLVDWLTNYVRPSTKEKTYSRYADVVYQHLIPKLGDYELQELTPLIVQRYITELLQNGNLKTGQGLSPNSVNSIITVIQGSMATAHLLELTDRYEMDKLKRPKAKEKPIECFTPTEQKQIEQAVMSDKREKMKGIVTIPDIGRPHPKVAITLRNQWMVDAADLVIAYVENSSGGAYKAMAYAEKTGKPVINLATDCEEEIWT